MAAQFRSNAVKVTEEVWERPARIHIPAIAPDFFFEFIARRIDITSLLYSGELPESFSNQVLARSNKQLSEDEKARLEAEYAENQTAEDKAASIAFQVKLAKQVCAAPRLMFVEAERAELIREHAAVIRHLDKATEVGDSEGIASASFELTEVLNIRKRFERLAAEEGTLDLSDVPFSGDLIIALFNYAMGLSPDVPVPTTDGGETTIKAVETFPDGIPGAEPVDAGANGQASGDGDIKAAENRG